MCVLCCGGFLVGKFYLFWGMLLAMDNGKPKCKQINSFLMFWFFNRLHATTLLVFGCAVVKIDIFDRIDYW